MQTHPLNYSGQCVSRCPQDAPLVVDGFCKEECPTNFEPNEAKNACQKKGAIALLEEGLQQNNFVPFPFMIGTFIFGISIVVAKFQSPETSVAGSLAGFCSLFEFASWVGVLVLNERD